MNDIQATPPSHREQINVEESVNATLACDDTHSKPFIILEPTTTCCLEGLGLVSLFMFKQILPQ